ncbi:MAG: M28 family peptidase [Gemmatimonadetes bacterium]|nr:M28 family peptidase [Gemmatimonadota bacterium]
MLKFEVRPRQTRWYTALSLLALLVAPGQSSAQRARSEPVAADPLAQGLAAITPSLIEAPLRLLADDLMEGRAPGTRGGDLAARYLASQFAGLGLKPGAPDGSFYQWVSLAGLTTEASVVVGAQRRTLVLEPGAEIVAWPQRADSLATLDAEIVFAGYGITAPEWDWDDYKGAAQTGRIVMVLPNEPGAGDSTVFRGNALTAYGLWTHKLEQAARMGAAGVLLVHTPQAEPLPWAAIRSSWSGERVLPDRPPTQSLRFAAWITADAARRIVEATGKDYGLLLQRARLRDFRPLDVGARAAVDLRSRVRRFRSPNVIARLDGADSLGRADVVLLTAHYDHLGMGPSQGTDSIYNGAVDNASGLAVMLAAATALSRAGSAPRRSVVFAATTASEAGGLGATTYLGQPPAPLDRTVAVVNLDRANVWGPTRDVVALGGELSTLGDWVTAAARAETLQVASDPFPHLGDFYQSDQAAFARAGIPAVWLRSGIQYPEKGAGWGAEQWRAYLEQRYHRPSDHVHQDFDYRGLVQLACVLSRLAWSLAQGTDFPTWLPGAEFRPAGQRLRPAR